MLLAVFLVAAAFFLDVAGDLALALVDVFFFDATGDLAAAGDFLTTFLVDVFLVEAAFEVVFFLDDLILPDEENSPRTRASALNSRAKARCTGLQ